MKPKTEYQTNINKYQKEKKLIKFYVTDTKHIYILTNRKKK